MTSLKDFRDAIGYVEQDTTVTEKFVLAGGLSIEEVAAIGDPGKLIYCSNYEPNYTGGYRSKAGTEPTDGQPQPSAFVYQAVQVTITNSANFPAVGQFCAVSGGTTGVYYLGNESVNGTLYLIFTCLMKPLMTAWYAGVDGGVNFLGALVNTDTLSTTGGQFGTVASNPTLLADTSKSYYYIAAARTVARNLIQPIGGTACIGKALGVFDWNGCLFGIRNKSDNSQALLFVATLNGWVQVSLGSILYYRLNTAQINVGDVLIGASSGATFTVTNVVNQFGTVGGGDALGYVSGNVTSGSFSANEFLQVSAVNVAKTPASGRILVANTLPAGGSYRFRRWNFTGVANNVRLYAVNGVGTAFELSNYVATNKTTSSVCLTPLITGVGLTSATFNAAPTSDVPNKIAAWQDQLFLGYVDGNLMHSGYQTPTNWTAVKGADDRTLGDTITNIIEDVNNAMIITTRNRVRVLYGDVNENFQLRDLATTFGAYADTACQIHGTTFLTDEGVVFYDQSAQFGNFGSTSISQAINSLLKYLMRTGAGPVESVISRDRSMYRLIFDGGAAISICIVGNNVLGIGFLSYGQNLHNFWSAASTIPVNSDNAPPPSEAIYCCGDDGYVYRDDTGSTFGANGDPIVTRLQTQFFYGQDIDKIKYYRRLYMDILGADVYTNLQLAAEFDDGYGYRTPEIFEVVTRQLAGSIFDVNSIYGFGSYGGAGKNVLMKHLHGSGAAISILAQTSSTVAFPHTLQAVALMSAVGGRRLWR